MQSLGLGKTTWKEAGRAPGLEVVFVMNEGEVPTEPGF
jgi:hypothetical protein